MHNPFGIPPVPLLEDGKEMEMERMKEVEEVQRRERMHCQPAEAMAAAPSVGNGSSGTRSPGHTHLLHPPCSTARIWQREGDREDGGGAEKGEDALPA